MTLPAFVFFGATVYRMATNSILIDVTLKPVNNIGLLPNLRAMGIDTRAVANPQACTMILSANGFACPAIWKKLSIMSMEIPC